MFEAPRWVEPAAQTAHAMEYLYVYNIIWICVPTDATRDHFRQRISSSESHHHFAVGPEPAEEITIIIARVFDILFCNFAIELFSVCLFTIIEQLFSYHKYVCLYENLFCFDT